MRMVITAVRRQIVGLLAWRPFGPGLEVADAQYQGLHWPAPRRLVVVRERIPERPDARGRRLVAVPGYTFHAVVTTLPLPPEDAWRCYNGRADSENRLRELKEDFGARGFCLASFDGTEAAFRLICFLFNLVALSKRGVTRNERPQLHTLRTRLLVVGAILGTRARPARLAARADRPAAGPVYDTARADHQIGRGNCDAVRELGTTTRVLAPDSLEGTAGPRRPAAPSVATQLRFSG